ncbi:hypothetical protein PMAYCL1PPCAC_09168, partial [Pristionchus mayeri]
RMTRIALVLLLASSALAFYIPSQEEKEVAWSKLDVVKDFNDGVPAGYELVFVSPIWRHGDRGPTEPFAGDVLTEDDWTFGGGGYGELSPIGMGQHFNLGKKLYERYAENNQFLNARYKAKEIYARSTDKNRTLISAMSNFAGMYSRATAENGTDYPGDVDGWPQTYVPIPIHTSNIRTDFSGAQDDVYCPRQDDLWDLAHQHPEYTHFDSMPRTQQTLQYLRDSTGSNADQINFDNVYLIRGGMLCESIHFPDNFTEWYPWYTADVKQRVEEIDDQNIDFQDGIFASGNIATGYGYDVDLTLEIPMIRGGATINEVLDNALGVLDCWATNNRGEHTRCTDADHFLNNLKYYVISGHDTTISAYLTVLEAKPYVLTSGGYPSYSAAIVTEFFIDRDSGDRKFRLLFHDDDSTDFRVITPFVSGCEMSMNFCSLEHFQALAAKYAPRGGMDQLCNQRLGDPTTTTTKAPPPPPVSSSPSTTTTKKPDDNGQTTTTVPIIPTTTSSSPLLSFLSATSIVFFLNLLF